MKKSTRLIKTMIPGHPEIIQLVPEEVYRNEILELVNNALPACVWHSGDCSMCGHRGCCPMDGTYWDPQEGDF